MKKVLIIGGNSEIAVACARHYKANGCHVILTGHKLDELPQGYESHYLDVQNCSEKEYIMFDPDILLYAAGRLDNPNFELTKQETSDILAINFVAAVPILTHFFKEFQAKNKGVIVGISSVAAVRGKASTVLYSSAKAGFDSFLSGLRNASSHSKVRVITVRPGYVRTKMIQHLKTPDFLTASTDEVAKKIVRHSLKGNQSIVYVKSIWRPIMFVIRNIPEFLFKKLKL